MLDIAIINETYDDITGYEELITQVFNEVMKKENIDRYYEVSVIFVTKEKIREINLNYRGIDSVTDVISFALFDSSPDEEIIKDTTNITTLGDIFICLDRMKEQAVEYGHSERRELAFLSCHGLFHLLGYDHNTKEEIEMFSKQEEVLNALNIKRSRD